MNQTFILSRCVIYPLVKLISGRLSCKSCNDSLISDENNEFKNTSVITNAVTSLHIDNSILTNSKVGIISGEYSLSSINRSAIYSLFTNLDANIHAAFNIRSSILTYEIGNGIRMLDGTTIYIEDSNINGNAGSDIKCMNIGNDKSTFIRMIKSTLNSNIAITAVNEMKLKIDNKTKIRGNLDSKIMAEIE